MTGRWMKGASGWLCGFFAALFLTAPAAFAAAPLDPARYPILDEKQLGQLNRIVQLSSQADGDLSNMVLLPGMRGADEHLRYQLAFMSYAVDAVVYNYTPAYRELGERASNNMLRKMIDYTSWGDVAPVSQGNPEFFPPEKLPLPTNYDPAVRFIMYSGHLLLMAATHEMLYDDKRLSQPNSIRFQYPPTFGYPNVWAAIPGKAFTYDLGSFTKQIYADFKHYGWKGDTCMPGGIFVLCNQPPIVGFKVYDAEHGTKYFAKVSKEYKKVVAQDDGVMDEKTKSWAGFYGINFEKWIPEAEASPTVDGWAGAFMHPWNKDLVESIYPAQRDRHLVTLPDGTATVKADPKTEEKPDNLHPLYSENQGFMAVLAAEVGDADTKAKMLSYADKYYGPQWSGDAYFYPISAEFRRAKDPADVWRRVQPLQSTSTLALARILPKDGLYNMYNHPFTEEHFKEPYVGNVAYPDVQVPRAVFDAQKKALVVTLRPGRTASAKAARSWTFNNLDSARNWSVWQDGRALATISAGVVKPAAGVTGLEMQGSVLKVTMPVAKETTFIVASE